MKDKITGYRELSVDEVSLINEAKQKGREMQDLIDRLTDIGEVDPHWIRLGSVKLQMGLMCLTRAIAKPDFFKR